MGFSADPDDAGGYRESQRQLMNERRARERDIEIPPVVNPARRAACEADVYLFLSTYFPSTFYGPWTECRREMVAAILHAIRYGGDQAIAAPRGEGKTSIVECVVIFALVAGLVRFPVIAAATHRAAQGILRNVKWRFDVPDRLGDAFGEDYPEICVPIRALKGWAQGAKKQTVAGERTLMTWGSDMVVFPTVPGSRISGAVLATVGLEAAVRGLRVGDLRPDLVIVDDAETRESVGNEITTARLAAIIESDLGGLAGPDKKLGRVMLCTCMRLLSIAFTYTAPEQKPGWSGKRYRFMEAWPARQDLWDEYTLRWQKDFQGGDKFARGANAYYEANRAAMDEGGKVLNPGRFLADVLPDGSQLEQSAIQHAYNVIARRGYEFFQTEYQNEPPEEEIPEELTLSAYSIQNRLNGIERRIVPSDCTLLTLGIDVGTRLGLNWVAAAWEPDSTGYVIDYGIQEVTPSDRKDERAIEAAIVSALWSLHRELERSPFTLPDGEIVGVDMAIIDSGYYPDAIHSFCRDCDPAVYRAGKGFGSTSKDGKSSFRPSDRSSQSKKLGHHWFESTLDRGRKLLGMDADWWKEWIHERLGLSMDAPGALSLFGDSARDHLSYAKHLTAETRVEVFERGKGIRRVWKRNKRNNHYFDASYMAAVAANVLGASVVAREETQAASARVVRPGAPVTNWFSSQKRVRR